MLMNLNKSIDSVSKKYVVINDGDDDDSWTLLDSFNVMIVDPRSFKDDLQTSKTPGKRSTNYITTWHHDMPLQLACTTKVDAPFMQLCATFDETNNNFCTTPPVSPQQPYYTCTAPIGTCVSQGNSVNHSTFYSDDSRK